MKFPCEYCASRNRECVYPDSPPSTKSTQQDPSSSNPDTNELIEDDQLLDDVLELIESINDQNGEQLHDGPQTLQSCTGELLYIDYDDSLSQDEALYNDSVLISNLALVSESLIWNKIQTLFPHKPNMSPMEVWILQFMVDWSVRHYASSRDTRQIQIWDDIKETLYATLELIQLGMYAFLGLMLLGNHDRRYLLGDTPIDDGLELSIAKVYDFAMNLYSYLLLAISRQMDRVLTNSCTIMEAKVLITSLSFLFAVLGSFPSGTCPLIDFNRGGNDFIAYNIGYRRTYEALLPLLRNLPFENKHGLSVTIDDENVMPILFFTRILEYIDTHTDELGTSEDVEIIRHAFDVFDKQVYRTTVTFTPLGYYHIFVDMTDEFWDLVYAQNPLALSWLNVLAAYALVFKLYFIRDNNIWVDYMNWYREWHGHKYFWDEPVYQAVVEQGYCVSDYSLLRFFNPLEGATINEIS